MHKLCPHCELTLPVSAFNARKERKDGLQSWCRTCHSAYASKKQREYKYGLDHAAYEQLLAEHNSACAICRDTEDLVIDHCHATGAVRGILCRNCNLTLGHANDDISRLLEAALYLEKSRA